MAFFNGNLSFEKEKAAILEVSVQKTNTDTLMITLFLIPVSRLEAVHISM
jgi:hypothetical protein